MWIEYKDGGTYTHYDKELVNEDGSIGGNVSLGDKIAFLYVAHTFSLVGYNNAKRCYMYSNEVFNTTSQPFSLITMKDKAVVAEGLWKENKAAFQGAGCKFGINLYALLKVGNEYKRCCIKTHGGAYGGWSEFITILGGATKEMIAKAKKDDKKLPFSFTEKGYNKVEKGAVAVTGHIEDKFGNVTFTVPVFKFIDKVSEEANAEAIAFDVELQEYLKTKIAKPATEAESAQAAPQQLAVTGESYEASMQAQAPKVEAPTAADMEQMYGEREPRNTGAMQPNTGFDMSQDDDLPF